MKDQEYAGFWIRVGASIIDTILLAIIIYPILSLLYGSEYTTNEELSGVFWDLVLNVVLPAVAIIAFWNYKSATPGKMALRLTIVDANTGNKPTLGQFIGRYFGYIVSAIPLMLGLIWVGIDKRKQGWHDKLAGTVVVRNKNRNRVKYET